MQDDDRREIMEKRSSLRTWRDRGRRVPRHNELLGNRSNRIKKFIHSDVKNPLYLIRGD